VEKQENQKQIDLCGDRIITKINKNLQSFALANKRLSIGHDLLSDISSGDSADYKDNPSDLLQTASKEKAVE